MNAPIGLIDDDDLFRARLAEELRAIGQPVAEARDARDGMTMLENASFETVLVDILMPGEDGIEMIGRIRARWPSMQVVAISGGGRLSADLCIDLAKASGADRGLKKPLSGGDVVKLLHEIQSH